MWGGRPEERPLVVAAPQRRLTPEWALLYHAQVLHLEWERWPGDGGLVGSRCLADNWKVPVLARPSVPCAYLPATFCLPQKGPALFHGTRARRLAGGGGGGRQLSILPLFGAVFLVLWCCQVCGKFAGCCQPAFRWRAGRRETWLWRQPVHSRRVSARLWTLVLARLPFSLALAVGV